MVTDYTPKPRTKLQFARLFVSSDDLSDRAALRWLHKEIVSNKQLHNKLCKLGYSDVSRKLTFLQQKLLFDHLSVKSSENL